MDLTRSRLEELQLDEATIDAVLQAHQAAVNQLRKGWEQELNEAAERAAGEEKDELRSEIEQLKKEGERADMAEAALEHYKAQQAAEAAKAQQEGLIRDALTRAGVNDGILQLLMTAVDTESVLVENGALVNESEMIGELRSRWPACFTAVRPEPAGGAHTTRAEAGYSKDELSLMTAEEINRCWPSIQEALRSW